MKRPATVSAGRSRPAGSSATERSMTRSWRKEPASRRSISSGRISRLSGAMPSTVAARMRSGSAELSDASLELLLPGQACGIEGNPAEDRAAHADPFDAHAALAADAVLERDEADVAGAVLVDGHGLRRTWVGPRRLAGSARVEGVPMPEREVVEAAGRDLGIGEEDVVVLDLARDGARAVDHAHLPAGALVAVHVEGLQRAVRSALGGEHATEDQEVEVAEQELGLLRREHMQELAPARRTGHGREVEGAVDRAAVVDVVRAGDDDDADAGLGEAAAARRRPARPCDAAGRSSRRGRRR